jgi:hypothetical protein
VVATEVATATEMATKVVATEGWVTGAAMGVVMGGWVTGADTGRLAMGAIGARIDAGF